MLKIVTFYIYLPKLFTILMCQMLFTLYSVHTKSSLLSLLCPICLAIYAHCFDVLVETSFFTYGSQFNNVPCARANTNLKSYKDKMTMIEDDDIARGSDDDSANNDKNRAGIGVVAKAFGLAVTLPGFKCKQIFTYHMSVRLVD
ncbi:hypothetical protein HELRODRAFT_174056 [Helobdella robusta]|uniref:Uncharacterized protein n=1 Tax=Helobdella robusta TaxID=6412 RepID=T1F7J5_HELRO|nr:hypothetical protein HELRODRAFT_174056 [Helobdella robusta]ESO03161.1 hypothetical protein HELRODRAFT_174056 [Helobdella robusta]